MKEANGNKRLDECIEANAKQDTRLNEFQHSFCIINADLKSMKTDIKWLRWLVISMIALQVGDFFIPNATQQLFAIIQGVINDVSNML